MDMRQSGITAAAAVLGISGGLLILTSVAVSGMNILSLPELGWPFVVIGILMMIVAAGLIVYVINDIAENG